MEGERITSADPSSPSHLQDLTAGLTVPDQDALLKEGMALQVPMAHNRMSPIFFFSK